MSTTLEQPRAIETLAWITDDEAEFWTVNIRWKKIFSRLFYSSILEFIAKNKE